MNTSTPAFNSRNLHLEAVRGTAALLVVLGHLLEKIPSEMLARNHFTGIFSNWGTEAVMIFFILSGIVIHASIERQQKTSRTFVFERIVRIHPTLFICLILSIAVEWLLFSTLPTWDIIVANLVPVSTLQGYFAPVLYNTNPVIWSLSFEVFFYMVFGCLMIVGRRISTRNVVIWLFISLCTIPFFYQANSYNSIVAYLLTMLAFSPIWIVGFYIWKFRASFPVTRFNALLSLLMLPLISRLHLTDHYYDPLKYLIFAICSVPFFMFCLKTGVSQPKHNKSLSGFQSGLYLIAAYLLFYDTTYTVTSKALYLSLPLSSFILNTDYIYKKTKLVYNTLYKPIFSALGKISYSLYLIHYPIIIAIFDLNFLTPIAKVATAIVTFLTLSCLMEIKIQPRIGLQLRRKTWRS